MDHSNDTPRFAATFFPEEEKDFVVSLGQNLSTLGQYVDDFFAALALFDHGSAQMGDPRQTKHHLGQSWTHMAARDGVLTIYHFDQLRKELPGLARQAPTLFAVVDSEKLTEGARIFAEGFKDFGIVRHSVAHSGSLSKNPRKREINSLKGPLDEYGVKLEDGIVGFYLGGNLAGRRYFASIRPKGKGETRLASYELSVDSLNILRAALKLTYEAFAPVDVLSFKLSREHAARTRAQPQTG